MLLRFLISKQWVIYVFGRKKRSISNYDYMAALNSERLAKIWNPGNVKLQTRNCKLKNLMLKVSILSWPLTNDMRRLRTSQGLTAASAREEWGEELIRTNRLLDYIVLNNMLGFVDSKSLELGPARYHVLRAFLFLRSKGKLLLYSNGFLFHFVCLAFVPFSQFYAKVLLTKPPPG